MRIHERNSRLGVKHFATGVVGCGEAHEGGLVSAFRDGKLI